MKKIIKILCLLIIGFSVLLLSCTKRTLTGIEVSNYIEFNLDSVDLSKIVINLKYDSGNDSKMNAKSDLLSSKDQAKLKEVGIHEVTIVYENFEAKIFINIIGDEFGIKLYNDEELLLSEKYSGATTITEPTFEKEKTGYTFGGYVNFKGEEVDITKEFNSNELIYVNWIKKEFTINYYVGEELFKTSKVFYGEYAPTIEEPKKEGSIFMGWDIELNNVLIYQDYELHARFNRTTNEIVIRYFVNDECVYSETIEYGTVPTKYDTKDIEGFDHWDVDVNAQFFEDTDIHAVFVTNPPKERVRVKLVAFDEVTEKEIDKGSIITFEELDKYNELYDLIGYDYDISQPIEEDVTITFKYRIKLEKAFDYVLGSYIPLLYGNSNNTEIVTNFYELYGFSGYTLKYNDYVLFLNNVYVITEEAESYIDDVPSPSTGTVYINKTDKSLTVNLDQIRCNTKSGYNTVACNEKGMVTAIIDNEKATSITIPKNGFIWSPSYNDGNNSNLSLYVSFRALNNSDKLVLTDWCEKINLVFQSPTGDLMKELSMYPGREIEYPETPDTEDEKFLSWNSDKKALSDTIYTAIYVPKNSRPVTLTVINGSGSGEYRTGETVKIVASEKANKEFSYWISGGVKQGTTKELDVLLTDDATYVAHYIDSYKLINLKVNGDTITYRNSSVNVTLPDALNDKLYGMRAAWVSAITGCVEKFKSESQYKASVTDMLDVLEYYNFNAVMFHIRIYNDAYYPSTLNPKSVNMNTDLDMLSWTIKECHARGIEFHAWMNPYRVKSSGGTDLKSVANDIKARCPANIGSDVKYLLGNSSGGVILNPGCPEVRDFLVETCMEVVENFDVDAIHFDDYFYIDGVDDSDTRSKYNKDNLSIADFRRQQVDLFIEQLSIAVRKYNKENNKFVQIGISPSGIWANGDGVVTYDAYGNAISKGSNTRGMEHYAGYLFSDTVNWINHEWIDYIMPQTYWAFTHKTAPYADLMDWWSAIVRYKNVKLYSGIGIYMADGGGNYSWGTNTGELLQQLTYISQIDNVSGCCWFKFQYVRQYYHNKANQYFKPMFDTLFKENWKHPALLYEVTSANDPLTLGPVGNLEVTVNENGEATINFRGILDARKYVVFRTDGILDFDEEEIVKIVGERTGNIEVTDTLPYHGTFVYYVYAISGSNTLGVPKTYTIKW